MRHRPRRDRVGDGGAVLPGHVRGQDERGDLPRRRRGDRVGGVRGDVGRRQRPSDPAGDRAGQGVDVGLQRRVQALVRAGVVADHVDQRRPGTAGVVQVREPVAEAGPQV